MNPERPPIADVPTFWTYVRRGLRRANKARPFSFYLLLLMPVVLLLGAELFRSTGNPKRFAFFLSLLFVAFFAIMIRAIFDFIEIERRHFSEREGVFRDTLGDREFASDLGKRVAENSDRPSAPS